jgi:hypothetical protein
MKHGRIICMLCLPVLFVMGCSGNRPPKNDPLVGINAPPLPKENKGAGAVAKSNDRDPNKPLPALPAPSADTSPAALASGGVPKLDGERNLRMDDKDAGKDPAASWRGKSSGVSLGPPDTPPDPTPPRSSGDIKPVGAVSAAPALDLRQMIASLEQRGMKGFRLDQQRDSGQWRCTCSIPSKNNPSVKQTYDHTAADPEAAVRAVLDQVEKDTR